MYVKLSRDLDNFNLSGYGPDFLTAKKGDIVEVSDPNGNRLMSMKFADYSREPAKEEEPEVEDTDTDDEDEVFDLQPEVIAHLRGLDKDDIAETLRLYGVEVDKRRSMDVIRKDLIENVSNALPDKMLENSDVLKSLIDFYADMFKIELQAVFYDSDNLSHMTQDVGLIIAKAFEDEDS